MTQAFDPTAPGDLELVRAFVNTRDVEGGTDAIASGEGLRAWLQERGLIADGESVSDADAARARDLREALRALLHFNHGRALDESAVERLNAIAARLPLTVVVEGDSVRLEPRPAGADRALARLLATVHAAMLRDTWKRLKACGNEGCQWAFYDHSKNLSRAWCSMAVCGNRMKVRAYQRRRKAAS